MGGEGLNLRFAICDLRALRRGHGQIGGLLQTRWARGVGFESLQC